MSNSKVKSLDCPSGIKGVVVVYEDPDETVQYTFWGYGTVKKLTPEDLQYITKFVQEIVSGS